MFKANIPFHPGASGNSRALGHTEEAIGAL